MDLLKTLNGAMAVVGTPSRQWLERTHHYEWITDYLTARGATGAIRIVMAMIPASMAACLLVLLLSADAPPPGLPSAMMWTAFGGGVAGTILWATRWPSRRQSLAFAFVTNASVALACLSFSDPQGALFGCVAFATSAAYIGFFHSTGLVIYNFVVASTVAIVIAARIAATGHGALAAVDLFLVTQINIVMPIAIHLLIRSLGVDLERAGRDPLTGLLNRRSFDRYAARMLDESDIDPEAHLVVVMIDLDNFKRLNDTRGHQAGDDALVAVGRALGQAVADIVAIVARTGGEEFVVAAEWHTDDPGPLAQRFCDGIAGLPMSITASVGAATVPIRSLRRGPGHLQARVNQLVGAADDAMYEAKRAGGNRYHRSSVH
ncbi:GGDEF domain-containing protein [Mycolicibacterium sp. 22603]|uniref:GGDEF domain-containing protein n=1 Tax=Mycolicibacterium sp. 22603 TaxID=3453950 RepID=UPI003F837E7F